MRDENINQVTRCSILIFLLMIVFAVTSCNHDPRSDEDYKLHGTQGTYVLQWQIMNMYKDNPGFEDWESTGDKIQRDVVFTFDGRGHGTIGVASGQGAEIKYVCENDGFPKGITITENSFSGKTVYKGTLYADGTLELFDGDKDDDYTVHYMFKIDSSLPNNLDVLLL